MKILFLKSVLPYRRGDVADVSAGYAKNFLIPQALAVPATVQAMQTAQQRKLTQAATAEAAEHDLDTLTQALTGATLHVEARAATSGTLYAAVTPAHIVLAVAKHTGQTLPPACHKQLPTLKHQGKHPVTLRIHATTITFTIDV